MTVAANSSRIQPTTDGVTTSFTCSFAILDVDHLRVYVDSTRLSHGSGFTLSGETLREGRNGYQAGFQVVLSEAPSASEVLTIYRDPPETQETRYYPSDPFLAEVPERTWDKLTMLAQDLSEQLGLTVKPGPTVPDGGDGTSPQVIPVGNAILFGIQADNADGSYVAAQVQWDGFAWYAVPEPILTSNLGEANACQDTEVGDVVVGYAFTDDTSGVTYRFEGIQGCNDETGSPEPEQSSDYYRLVDCASSEADIVTSANLTRLVGRVVNSGGVCYTVSEESDGTGAVTGVSISTAWTDCQSCSDATDPPLDDLVNVFAQMARCDDDVLVDYWLPEIQFGLPGDEDLTKVYKYLGVCYYVSNVRADTPGILFPSGQADIHDTCELCSPCGDACCPTYDVEITGCPTHNGTHTVTRDPGCALEWSNRDDVATLSDFVFVSRVGGTWTAQLSQKDGAGVGLDLPIESYESGTAGDCPPTDAWVPQGGGCPGASRATITDNCA